MRKLLRIAVSVLLLIWLAWRTDWSQVGEAFARLNVACWLAALGLYLAAQVVSGLRWQLLAGPLGFHAPVRRYVGYNFIGMYFNLFLPTSVGGDVVRAWYLNGGSARGLTAFLTVVLDRLSGLLVLLVMTCVAVVFCPIDLPPWIGWCVWSAAGCGLLGMSTLALRYSVFTSKAPVAQRAGVVNRRARIQDGLRPYLRRPRLLLGTTALSLLVQALNVAIVWLIGEGLHLPVPAAYYWIVAPMVTLLTLLPISLNGMGVREGGIVLFLAPVGVETGAALSLAWLWFAVFLAGALIGGVVYLFGSFTRPEGKDDGLVRGDSDQGRARQPKAAA